MVKVDMSATIHKQSALSGDLSGSNAKDRRRAQIMNVWQVWIVDLAAILLAITTAQWARFGYDQGDLALHIGQVDYSIVGLGLLCVWWLALLASGAHDLRIFGSGPEEYKRVLRGSFGIFTGLAIASYLLKLDTARGYVAIAFPLGILLLLLGRKFLRAHRRQRHRSGVGVHRVLIVGSDDNNRHLHSQLSSALDSGYWPVAQFLTPNQQESTCTVVSALLSQIQQTRADTVALTSSAALEAQTIRELGWVLSQHQVALIIAPALTDIASPRMHLEPVAGLPLIHVSSPRIEGMKAFLKTGSDFIVALILLVVLFVPMAILALLVKLDSRGPVLFAQERIGRHGQSFSMLKFRSMKLGAEAQLAALEGSSDGNSVLFKMRHDPRVTRTGTWMRRYSLDELPQLINVLRGEMSLVGPRPPLPREVSGYDAMASRRLLVKPGITGLWQVSGRSDLSWEQSIRLDLYYVENWSLTQDLMILVRTVRAVVSPNGAY